METTQEQSKPEVGTLKELLDKLAWQRESEALYDAFIEALNTIGDRDIKSDCCLNTVKYMATENARARATDKLNDEEVATLFEEECKRFSGDILSMPGQFREWLKSGGHKEAAATATEPRPSHVSIIDIILSSGGISCNCPRCREFKKATEASETPTEPPPPPPPGEEAAL